MKLKDKFKQFFIAILFLFISYSLCSTHEIPISGYVSRRKSFCSMPFYIYIIIAFVLIFILNF